MGMLAGAGLGPSYVYQLQVRGRKSGKIYSTPVSLVRSAEKQYLVAPRGRTQWVRNAEAAGDVTLKRSSSRRFRLRPLNDGEKPLILKSYLSSYKGAVQRFFPLTPDAPVDAFANVAADYPVFELIPI